VANWAYLLNFLNRDVYAPLTNPAIVPTLTSLVEYGHLLIGLSLLSGLFVRISALMLMLLYWTAHISRTSRTSIII